MNIKAYLDYINSPWGMLFYRSVWRDLCFSGKKILDFGSGFGITADHLAEKNSVTAIEPNEEMQSERFCENNYEQVIGSTDKLRCFADSSFDVIICHNVLEYIEEREKLISEFKRLLKNGGILSVVKHNKAGKIMHKAVFEYKTDEALNLLNGESGFSENFGEINEYEVSELEQWLGDGFNVKEIRGIRIFYGLQSNDLKSGEEWSDRMFELETAASAVPSFREIAFFHHLIIEKI